jgi:hypothetical protein
VQRRLRHSRAELESDLDLFRRTRSRHAACGRAFPVASRLAQQNWKELMRPPQLSQINANYLELSTTGEIIEGDVPMRNDQNHHMGKTKTTAAAKRPKNDLKVDLTKEEVHL